MSDLDQLPPEKKNRSPVIVFSMVTLLAAASGGYWLAVNNQPNLQAPTEAPQSAVVASAPEPVLPAPAAPEVVVEAPAKIVVATPESVEPAVPADKKQVAAPVPDTVEPEPVKPEKVVPEQDVSEKATLDQTKPDPAMENEVAIAAPAVTAPKKVDEKPEQTVKTNETAPVTDVTEKAIDQIAVDPIFAPSFDTVRVEPDGDTVIAGRAAPNADVRVIHNGKVVGNVQAAADGSFVFISEKPLPAGAGALSLETEVAGKKLASENTIAVAIAEQAKTEALVAVIKPDQPTDVVQVPSAKSADAPAKTVVMDSVDYDDAGNIVFSGRSKPEANVNIFIDNALEGTAKASPEGKWTYTGTASVLPGPHQLRVDAIDANGIVMSRVELPFLREAATKVAAAEEAQDAVAENQATASDPTRFVIQPGNSLWKVSRLMYGAGTKFTIIYEANKDQIRDPDLIYPGQVFVVPTSQAPVNP